MPPLLVPVTRAVFWEDIVADRCKSMQELVEAVGYQPCKRLQAKNFLQRMGDEFPPLEGRGMQVIYPHTFHIHRSGIWGLRQHMSREPRWKRLASLSEWLHFASGSSEIQGFNYGWGLEYTVTATISNAGWPD